MKKIQIRIIFSLVRHDGTETVTAEFCGIKQYSEVVCGTLQYSVVLCGTLQFSAVLCSSLQFSGVLFSTLQYSAVLCSRLQRYSACSPLTPGVCCLQEQDGAEEEEVDQVSGGHVTVALQL